MLVIGSVVHALHLLTCLSFPASPPVPLAGQAFYDSRLRAAAPIGSCVQVSRSRLSAPIGSCAVNGPLVFSESCLWPPLGHADNDLRAKTAISSRIRVLNHTSIQKPDAERTLAAVQLTKNIPAFVVHRYHPSHH